MNRPKQATQEILKVLVQQDLSEPVVGDFKPYRCARMKLWGRLAATR
jgi:hypothetical protein